ncbi:MAG: hypothetical protein CSA55_02410 [Ilumatobacter coccineus]|uniref:Uncharacterized protein n=1 Tax=Ilumatobacter coccineus TaxID=467094 RepID=A0A2G6KCH9_9ACTN|nr:MAG: hypothetical protein CSA55_02410 [Ilumatobacter coccineus]
MAVVAGCGADATPDLADVEERLADLEMRADAADAERDALADALATQHAADQDEIVDTSASSSTTTAAASTTTEVIFPEPAAPDASPFATVFGDLGELAIPRGAPGELAVVATTDGLDRTGSLGIIVRNNTPAPIGRVEIAVEAQLDGEVIGTGESTRFQPTVVGPGEISWGYAYFDVRTFPEGTTFDLSVTSEPLDGRSPGLKVIEVNQADSYLLGTVENQTDATVDGPMTITMACFDAEGSFVGIETTMINNYDIPPGQTGSFDTRILGVSCDRGLAAASGYYYG